MAQGNRDEQRVCKNSHFLPGSWPLYDLFRTIAKSQNADREEGSWPKDLGHKVKLKLEQDRLLKTQE